MKLNYIIIAALAGLFASCSNIADDERLVYVAPATVNRNVLIEDFTGQRCVNCPKAANSIHEIQEVYGENIIPVAIHCGSAIGGKNGLMISTGSEYWSHWFSSDQGQPVAKINRGAATSDYENWSAAVAKALEKETNVTIGCNANSYREVEVLNVETKETEVRNYIDIVVEAQSTEGCTAKLQVWLTEDNIIGRQMMPDGSTNLEYVHNHVFRSAVNGTWGEDITFKSFDPVYKTYRDVELDPKWVPANMHAVVFVYNDEEVLQVIQTPLVAKSE